MKIQNLIQQLKDSNNEADQIDAVEKLKDNLDIEYVFKVLCITSVSMVSAKVRESILAALQPKADKANDWFVRAARNTTNATSRRMALLNLSLMESCSADTREVVLQGLNDPDQNIQHAAALCAGLFDDAPFMKEVGLFLDRNRFIIACTGFQRAMFKAPRGIHGSVDTGSTRNNSNGFEVQGAAA